LELAKLLRAVGVAALADREIGVLLAQGHLAIERRDAGDPYALALPRARPVALAGQPPQHGVERRDMRHVGAAAAADEIDAVLVDEALLPLRQLARRQRIVRLAVHQLRQAGIGLDRDRTGPVLAQPFDM